MPEATAHPLLQEVERSLGGGGSDAALLAALDAVLAHFGCAAGTVHTLDPATGMLRLRARRNIPDALLDRVSLIPVGKGMAGLAAERRQPVQVCNLQADLCGVANPGARETRLDGTIAVPMLVAGEVRGVLGVGKPTAYQFTDAESALLLDAARLMGQFLSVTRQAP